MKAEEILDEIDAVLDRLKAQERCVWAWGEVKEKVAEMRSALTHETTEQ